VAGSLDRSNRFTEGVLISYEAVVMDGGKRREVAVGPNGSPMKADGLKADRCVY
jgi:hypothetical protein